MGIEFCIWWWQLYRQRRKQKRRQPAEAQAQDWRMNPPKSNASERAQPLH